MAAPLQVVHTPGAGIVRMSGENLAAVGVLEIADFGPVGAAPGVLTSVLDVSGYTTFELHLTIAVAAVDLAWITLHPTIGALPDQSIAVGLAAGSRVVQFGRGTAVIPGLVASLGQIRATSAGAAVVSGVALLAASR